MAGDVLDDLIGRFRDGERGALARLLTLIDNDDPRSAHIVDLLYPDTGKAQTVGVTGPPGAGKSTLVNALIGGWRAQGRSVGVLAVDPSSALSGGAALGDRIRMLDTWSDDEVFVRSMASRGQLGGLSPSIAAAIHLLDAFGFDVICVETVGVGQGEVDIARVADTTVLVQVPGLGDTVQLLKAGVLEIADVLVVNKADNEGAQTLANDLRSMIRSDGKAGWQVPVVETDATSSRGIDDLIRAIDDHFSRMQSDECESRRRERLIAEVEQVAVRSLRSRVMTELSGHVGSELLEQLLGRRIGPRTAAQRIVERVTRSDA